MLAGWNDFTWNPFTEISLSYLNRKNEKSIVWFCASPLVRWVGNLFRRTRTKKLMYYYHQWKHLIDIVDEMKFCFSNPERGSTSQLYPATSRACYCSTTKATIEAAVQRIQLRLRNATWHILCTFPPMLFTQSSLQFFPLCRSFDLGIQVEEPGREGLFRSR